MTKLTPDSFELPLVHEAHRLVRSAMNNSVSHNLDPRTSMWVVRTEAWDEFRRSRDFIQAARFNDSGRIRNELFGLPVRVTIGDETDVPMIQLVMEPQARPR